MQTATAKVEHLYVHVPFCAAKCDYCAFYSETGAAAKMSGYVDAVLLELERSVAALAKRGHSLVPTTVFFGGGTPSIVTTSLMRRILDDMRRYLPLEGISEWTVECNPSTVSTEKARLFRESGVNRISMGVQSLDDDFLKRIGRIHTVKAGVESYEKLRRAGFDNVNLDLMFGLPGQTMEHWRTTLRRAIELQPEHISAYCLILEEDTVFWRLHSRAGVPPAHSDNSRTGILPVHPGSQTSSDDGQARRLSYVPLPTDDEQQLAMYETAIEILAAAGYRQYEVSNFSMPSRECVHNIAYWEGKDYIGLGPSACSTVGSRRWQNVAEIDRYVEAISHRRSTISFEETITPGLRAAERAAFGMRMTDGVPADLVRGRWDKQIAELLSAELVQWRNNRLQPTKRGILFADEVAAAFV